jgi:hypothetical protein
MAGSRSRDGVDSGSSSGGITDKSRAETQPARNLKSGGTSGSDKESQALAMTEHNQAQSAVLDDAEIRRLLDLRLLDDSMRKWMLTQLRHTTDARLRNVVALKLAENGVGEAIPVLKRLMDGPETAGARGTLLYALAELGAKLPPKELLNLMMTDTYEVQTQAFEMLENTVNGETPGDLQIMLNWVLERARGLDGEHREAAHVASDLLVSAFFEQRPAA